MNSSNERIAKLTNQARKKLNLTQRDFAEYLKQQGLKISYRAIQDMENKKVQTPNPIYWKVIAPLTGYTMEGAIAYIIGEEKTEDIKTQTIKNISLLTNEDLQEIAKIIAKKLSIQGLPELTKIIAERFEQEINFKRMA